MTILLDGQQVPIPTDIGITETRHFNPHTHDATGKIHVGEGLAAGIDPENSAARFTTLKDFFDVWRTTGDGTTTSNPIALFDSTHIMDKTADATHVVHLYVNGALNTQFENYVPEDADRVVISYEAASVAGTPTFAPITDVTLLAGAPLFIPLDGSDPQNQGLTYTVTSSNPQLVTGTIPTGNPSLLISVRNFGDMRFQLNQDLAPRPVNRVVELANEGFYNGLIFHRVIDNFVIQGGDPNGTGTGGSPLGNFDDNFNVNLQHTSTGVLSFAKSSDDTNNSQFFITEGSQRHLDFNHSVFGHLTEGENVRDLISNVATDANGKPTTNVVMSSVTVGNDTENGVLMLTAPEGANGNTNVTVTVRDSDNHTFSRTFHVSVQPDPINGGPFLNDIPVIRTVVNTAATFQLTSHDPESNAVQYSAVKADSVASTVTVNPTTGQLTATPPNGFVGTMQFKATVQAATGVANDTGDKSDNQVFTIFVAPSAPTSVNLQDASDSGISNTDNLTNQKNSLQFLVSGVTANATVQLRDGQTVIGSATAIGSTVVITTNVVLNDGAHSITAIQKLNAIDSDPSAALGVTVDSAAPATFTSTPPTEAQVGTLLTYNTQNSEEGTTGFRYSLVTAPTGLAMDGITGVVTWTPTAAQIGAQTFGIVATDAAGNAATQTVNLAVANISDVTLRLAITDSNGNPLAAVNVGDSFVLRAFVQDRRATAQGVFSFYADVVWDPAKATTTGPIVYSATYNSIKSGDTTVNGELNEVGATASTITPVGGDELPLFTVPMRATASGALQFTSNLADSIPAHNVLVFGSNNAVNPSKIGYGSASTNVQSAVGANSDTFNVNEDTTNNSLDPRTNDTKPPGFVGELTITQVGATNHGGTVSVSASGTKVLYSPAANFVGAETFTYTVKAGVDASVGTVTVQVANLNDPPTAVNDAFNASEDQSADLDVLANDTDIDPIKTLTITAVGTPSQGGAVTIDGRGKLVTYRPKANFTGTETFTYTIADVAGATSTATTTVTVGPLNDPPTAGNDTTTVNEDSADNTINVLANDSFAPDTNETLTITAVGATNNATVTIAADRLTLKYTPKPNFQGTDNFTYTISDGNGGTATATVTATVTNINDPPTATDDTFNVLKNSSSQTLAVLANDSSNPDPTEVLTIQAVTQGSQGGTLTIAQNGKSVNYAPVTNFLGTETFTYTINDGHGGTKSATATVTVINFRPSTFSGFVFVDANNDGIRQPKEAPLAGVKVTLTGTDTVSNAAVHRDGETGADGAYSFTNLAPGNYKVREATPLFIQDGRDVVGSQGGSVSANDELTVQLAENTTGRNNNFGELGRSAQFLSIRDFLSSAVQDYLLVAAQPVDDTAWYSLHAPTTGGTSNPAITDVQFTTAQSTIHIMQGNTVATVNTNDPQQATKVGQEGAADLFRIPNPSHLTFVPITNSAPPSGSGEGEGAGSLTATSGAADAHVTFASPSLTASGLSALLAPPTASGAATTPLTIANFTSRAVASHQTQRLVDAVMSVAADDTISWGESQGEDSLVLHDQSQEDAATDLVLADDLWHSH